MEIWGTEPSVKHNSMKINNTGVWFWFTISKKRIMGLYFLRTDIVLKEATKLCESTMRSHDFENWEKIYFWTRLYAFTPFLQPIRCIIEHQAFRELDSEKKDNIVASALSQYDTLHLFPKEHINLKVYSTRTDSSAKLKSKIMTKINNISQEFFIQVRDKTKLRLNYIQQVSMWQIGINLN